MDVIVVINMINSLEQSLHLSHGTSVYREEVHYSYRRTSPKREREILEVMTAKRAEWTLLRYIPAVQ